MKELAAIIILIILFILSIFQLSLIFGAPFGEFAWGGQQKILSMKLRISSATSIFIYILIAILILDRANIFSVIPFGSVGNYLIWILVIYSCVGVLLNGISQSKKERFTMTPVAFLLFILTLILAIV